MTGRVLLIAVQVLLAGDTGKVAAAGDGSASRTPYEQEPCTATVERTGPARLRDGSTITIDPSSAVRNGDRVFIAGTPTLIWPRGAGRTDGPISEHSSFGFIRNRAGEIVIVPPPPTVVAAQHPRVASAGAAGWHVIFLTGMQERYGLRFPHADLWYGLFDGRVWRELTKIGHAQAASLLPEMSSDLVATAQGLRFAYSFDPRASPGRHVHGNQGVVMLHGKDADWSADTLFTWEGPHDIRLVANVDGSVTAMMAQDYFENGRFRGPSLFLARHDTGWSAARLVLDIAPRYIMSPRHASAIGGPETIISWRAATAGETRGDLEWGLLSASGTVRRMGPIAPVELSVDRPTMFPLSSGRVLWLVRSGESRHQLRGFVGSSAGARSSGVFEVPLDNSKLVGVSLPGDTVIFVSGRLGTLATEAFGMSYLTTIAVRCRSKL